MGKYAIRMGHQLGFYSKHTTSFPSDLVFQHGEYQALNHVLTPATQHIKADDLGGFVDKTTAATDGCVTITFRYTGLAHNRCGNTLDDSQLFAHLEDHPETTGSLVLLCIASAALPMYAEKLKKENEAQFTDYHAINVLMDNIASRINATAPENKLKIIEEVNREFAKNLDQEKFKSVQLRFRKMGLARVQKDSKETSSLENYEIYLEVEEQPSKPKRGLEWLEDQYKNAKAKVFSPAWMMIILIIMSYWLLWIFRAAIMGSYDYGLLVGESLSASLVMTAGFSTLIAILPYLGLKMMNWLSYHRSMAKNPWVATIHSLFFKFNWIKQFDVSQTNNFLDRLLYYPRKTINFLLKSPPVELVFNFTKILVYDWPRYCIGSLVAFFGFVKVKLEGQDKQTLIQGEHNNFGPPEKTLRCRDECAKNLGTLIRKVQRRFDFKDFDQTNESLAPKAISKQETLWKPLAPWSLQRLTEEFQRQLNMGRTWWTALTRSSTLLLFVTGAASAWIVSQYLAWQFNDSLTIGLSNDFNSVNATMVTSIWPINFFYTMGVILLVFSALYALDTAFYNYKDLMRERADADQILQKIQSMNQRLIALQGENTQLQRESKSSSPKNPDDEKNGTLKKLKHINAYPPKFSHAEYLQFCTEYESDFVTGVKWFLLVVGPPISAVTMLRFVTVENMTPYLPFTQATNLMEYKFLYCAIAASIFWLAVKGIEVLLFKDNIARFREFLKAGEDFCDYQALRVHYACALNRKLGGMEWKSEQQNSFSQLLSNSTPPASLPESDISELSTIPTTPNSLAGPVASSLADSLTEVFSTPSTPRTRGNTPPFGTQGEESDHSAISNFPSNMNTSPT